MLHWVYLVSLVLVGLLFLLFAIYYFPKLRRGEGGEHESKNNPKNE